MQILWLNILNSISSSYASVSAVELPILSSRFICSGVRKRKMEEKEYDESQEERTNGNLETDREKM